MGAWIETVIKDHLQKYRMLLPLWEHGLKRQCFRRAGQRIWVAPFMGAWIETPDIVGGFAGAEVAPFMGAWIETFLFPL